MLKIEGQDCHFQQLDATLETTRLIRSLPRKKRNTSTGAEAPAELSGIMASVEDGVLAQAKGVARGVRGWWTWAVHVAKGTAAARVAVHHRGCYRNTRGAMDLWA